MKVDKLGDIFQITSGGTPSRRNKAFYENGSIPWVKTGDLKTKYVENLIEQITPLGLKKSSAKLFPAKTVLLAMYGATIGNCSILKFEASTNQACAAFLPNSKVNEDYLYFFLKAIQKRLIQLGQGGGQPNLSATLLKSIKIPIPNNFDDQTRTVILLNKVESVITKRKKSIEDLDDLVKSTFREMFGDPVRNERDWEKAPCEKVVINIKPGASYGGEEKSILEEDELGVAKISAVTRGFFNPTEFKAVKKSKIRKNIRRIRKGDFLFSRANTIELVAACCVVNKDYPFLFLPDKLWALTFEYEIVQPQYFNFLLKNSSFRNVVKRKATGGHDSMLNISMKKFYTLQIPLPPLPLQNKFAAIVEKVEFIKERYRKSLIDLEILYDVLSQKAFKGELDLSRIPLGKEARPQKKTVEFKESVLESENEIIANPTNREQYLRLLFEKFLFDMVDGELLLIDDIISEAEERFMEEDSDPFGIKDYEMAKQWVFELLESGRARQRFNEEENRMEIRLTA